ncbi:SHOCT domain-containing protein [Pseudomonas sp. SP16.1]|uniref:SHOCT domain-containing protein n=1 Tax=Pseudomonas sp. SP16.1 TaxID=3458854 RepID=UPI004045F62D
MRLILKLIRALILFTLIAFPALLLTISYFMFKDGASGADIFWLSGSIALVCLISFWALKRSRLLLISNKIDKKAITITKEAINNQLVKLDKKIEESSNKRQFIEKISKQSTSKPLTMEVLGGHGWDKEKGNTFLLSLSGMDIILANLSNMTTSRLAICDVIDIEISGPGKETSNAGIIGGGFGVEGAIKGIAAATIVNILTTRSSVRTFIRIATRESEIILFTSEIEPNDARIYLSQVYASTRNQKSSTSNTGIAEQLTALQKLKEDGVLSDNEFNQAKMKILS